MLMFTLRTLCASVAWRRTIIGNNAQMAQQLPALWLPVQFAERGCTYRALFMTDSPAL